MLDVTWSSSIAYINPSKNLRIQIKKQITRGQLLSSKACSNRRLDPLYHLLMLNLLLLILFFILLILLVHLLLHAHLLLNDTYHGKSD